MLFYKGFDKMKWTLTIALALFALSILAQDKFYTKGLANGYAWTASPSVSKLAYSKSESLTLMLHDMRVKTEIQRMVSFPLDCKDDIDTLLRSGSSSTIELETIEIMIDEFYEKKENLVIPVVGAYCYNIKKLAGYNSEELTSYIEKLIDFSNSDLK
jgi:hypothetical protein